MRKKKRRYYKKVRKKVKAGSGYAYPIMIFSLFFFFVLMLFVGRGAKTTNYDAKRVRTNKSVAFYPRQTEEVGKAFVKKLCKTGKKDSVYDYETYRLKDYYCYDYGNGHTLFVDKEFKEPRLKAFSDKGKRIISDYLRYTMKAAGRQEAYTGEFMEETYYTNIKTDDFKYHFNKDSFVCQFDKYDTMVEIPLKYIAQELGLDLGIPNEDYVKPVYIDPNRPAVALTFDDGPSINSENTNKILDELYKYDATATFYVVGRSLNETTAPVIEKGLKLGNQYGSHSQTHANLVKLKEEQMTQEVMGVSDFFEEHFDYKVTTYRPPYGSYNETVDRVVPLPAVLWDVDSSDWESRNSNAILSNVITNTKDSSVVLLHDIHEPSMKAVVEGKMVKTLIDKGYQLVTVDELAKLKGVELVQGVHFCWD